MTTAPRSRWVALATLAISVLLITLDNSILYTALPTLTADLGASETQSLWIINAYPLVMAGLLLGSGALGDRFGHRRIYILGLAGFAAASLLAAFAPAPALLIAARGLLAIGAALMMPATLALVRHIFTDERERNLAIAMWGSVSVVGASLGPVAGGLLLQWFWWGSVFLVNVPIALAAILAATLTINADHGSRRVLWDAGSTVLALVGLGAAVLFIEEIPREKNWPVFIATAVIAVIALGWFARRQRRLTTPLLDLGLFRSRGLSVGVLAAALASLVSAGVQLVTTQRFQAVEQFTPLQAGLLVACIALGALVTGLTGGSILHRTGPRPLIAGGLASGAAGLALGTLLLPAGWGWLAAGLFIAGLGAGFVMATASILIVTSAPLERAGMAGAIEGVTYEFGALIAIATIGSIFTSLTATLGHAAAHTTSLWAVAAVLAVFTPICAALLRHTPTPRAEQARAA